MTYTIALSSNTYRKWETYQQWDDQMRVARFDEWLLLDEWLLHQHPELVSTDLIECNQNKPYRRIFEFESEAHYHFFLLKQ